jgi:hypothetical protein
MGGPSNDGGAGRKSLSEGKNRWKAVERVRKRKLSGAAYERLLKSLNAPSN